MHRSVFRPILICGICLFVSLNAIESTIIASFLVLVDNKELVQRYRCFIQTLVRILFILTPECVPLFSTDEIRIILL